MLSIRVSTRDDDGHDWSGRELGADEAWGQWRRLGRVKRNEVDMRIAQRHDGHTERHRLAQIAYYIYLYISVLGESSSSLETGAYKTNKYLSITKKGETHWNL